MQKKISFIIKASQEFFRHTEEEEKINAPVINKFFESISNLYIPLLNMLEKFETEGNNFCFSISADLYIKYSSTWMYVYLANILF